MQIKCAFLLSWIAGQLLLAPATAAKDYVNESRTIAAPPQSTTEKFTFIRANDDLYPNFDLAIDMSQGGPTSGSSIQPVAH